MQCLSETSFSGDSLYKWKHITPRGTISFDINEPISKPYSHNKSYPPNVGCICRVHLVPTCLGVLHKINYWSLAADTFQQNRLSLGWVPVCATLNSKRKYTLLDLSSTNRVADLRWILGVPNMFKVDPSPSRGHKKFLIQSCVSFDQHCKRTMFQAFGSLIQNLLAVSYFIFFHGRFSGDLPFEINSDPSIRHDGEKLCWNSNIFNEVGGKWI